MSSATGYQLQVIQQTIFHINSPYCAECIDMCCKEHGLTVPRYNKFKWHGKSSTAEAVSLIKNPEPQIHYSK